MRYAARVRVSFHPYRTESTTAMTATTDLTDKQQRILQYLHEKASEQTYFKSRHIGEDLGLSPREVGVNMPPIERGEFEVHVEKWGYSSSTTWKVTV